MKNLKNFKINILKKHRTALLILMIIFFITSFIAIRTLFAIPYGHVMPNYEKISINNIIYKNNLSNDDYKTLFLQTGLGKIAIDKLLEEKNYSKILYFQDKLFEKVKIRRDIITPITFQESIVNEENKSIYGTDIAYIDNGYILVTRATCSLGWRHGHAAIVTDKDKKIILEAAVLGQNSQFADISRWRYYPNFAILKLKGDSQDKMNQIANYASNKLFDIPYSLTVGIFSPKFTENTDPLKTQCSHLAWYPYMKYGYDLDSDKGPIVTPMDLLDSDEVEIVQIYGFNPKNFINN